MLTQQSVFANIEIQDAQKLLAEGKLNEALTVIDGYLVNDKKNIEARFIKGLIVTKMNKLDEAEKLFVKLTKEHPELPEPYNNLAVIYAAKGEYEKARMALQEAINTHPSYATAHENIGDLYAKMASQAYNQALQLDEGNQTAKEKLSLIGELFSVPEPKIRKQPKKEARETPKKQVVVKSSKDREDKAPPKEKDIEVTSSQPLPVKKMEQDLAQATANTSETPEDEVQKQTEIAKLETPEVPEGTIDSEQEKKQVQEEEQKAEIISVVNEWANAWSQQDVDAYLAFYGEEYNPPKNMSRDEWVTQRKVWLSKPNFIKVEIDNPVAILHGDDHAQVNFSQVYRSDNYKDKVKKTLMMKNIDHRWQIIEEISN